MPENHAAITEWRSRDAAECINLAPCILAETEYGEIGALLGVIWNSRIAQVATEPRSALL